MKPIITIIIVTANAEKHIYNCINSIYKHLPNDYFEIILSDNSSSDDTIKIVQQNFPNVKIMIGENRGYGAGNNRGIRKAKGDYFLILNDDTILIDNSFMKMFSYIKNDERIGLIGPKLLNKDLTLQRSITRHPTMWWMLLKMALPRRILLRINNSGIVFYLVNITKMNFGRFSAHGNEIKEVDGIKGCCLLVRKDAILNVGLFDENIFLQTEESDIAKRLQLKGYKVIYYPISKIIHLGGATTGRAHDLALNRVFIQKYLSDYYYFSKHRNSILVKGYKLILSVILLIKMGFIILIFPFCNVFTVHKDNINRGFEAYTSLFKCLWIGRYKNKNIFLDMEFKYL